jgi:hypothetical protein
MRAWSRHRPDGAMLRAVTIVNGSTVCCVQSVQRIAVPLVNASSSRRMILRTMRRERSRGSQLMNVPTDLSVVGQRTAVCEDLRSMPCPVSAGRMRAPLAVSANGGSAVRH